MTMEKINFRNPDYSNIVLERLRRLDRIRKDKRLLEAAIVHYGEHPVDFIQDWLWTYDPRQSSPTMPFILFKRQREFILWLKEKLENKEDGLTEKSRDMGVTWLTMAFSIWAWRFRKETKISFGSRKEKLVDELGNPDSIFEKGRLMLRRLPRELLPVGYDHDKHAPYMKIMNPDNGSVIAGEAGDNIGRGGRSTIYFKDESAFYERPDKIEAALSQNSDVKIDVSTPNGPGNPFARKRFSGKIDVFTFHWKQDPRKDEAWYKKQCDTLDAFIVAQEIDIDYHASTDRVVIPAAWVRAAVGLVLDDSGATIAGLDVADEGGDANAWCYRKGPVYKSFETWKEGDTTYTTRKAFGLCIDAGVDALHYDSIGVGAGVKGESRSLVQTNPNLYKRLAVKGVNVGDSGKKLKGLYEGVRKNSDMFANRKAMEWWNVRRRFERTYKHVNGIHTYPHSELISIPNRASLIAELSVVTWDLDASGKIIIESKKQLRTRGIKSPNEAEALILCSSKPSSIDYTKLTEH